jgi:shikimate kinase
MENYKENYLKLKNEYPFYLQEKFYGTEPYIIHIIGPSGSGKTTLGERLSKFKNIIVKDIDEIDDKNSLLIIENKEYDYLFTKKNLDKYFRLLEKMNLKDIKDIINMNPDKIIIFVGLSIDIFKFITFGYCIDNDPATIFFQVNKRNLDNIIKNKDELLLLLNSNQHIEKIFEITIKKYKIRTPFITSLPIIYDNIDYEFENAKKFGYKIMKSEEIYQDIVDIIFGE